MILGPSRWRRGDSDAAGFEIVEPGDNRATLRFGDLRSMAGPAYAPVSFGVLLPVHVGQAQVVSTRRAWRRRTLCPRPGRPRT